MENPKMLAQDLSRYTLTATSTNASYPLTNLQTYFAADEWRSDSTAADQYLNIDLGAARNVSAIVIGTHNFDLLGADKVSLYGATAANYSDEVKEVDDLAVATDPNWFPFTQVTKRYWRIKFALAVGSLSVEPALGNLYLGDELEFSSQYEFGAVQDDAEFQTTKAVNLSGEIRAAQAIGGRGVYELRFMLQDDTLRSDYQTFMKLCRGGLRPFYFLDSDGTTIRYVHAEDYVPIRKQRYGRSDIARLRLVTQQADYTG